MPQGLKQVAFWATERQHRALKVLAVHRGVPIAHVMREAVEQLLDDVGFVDEAAGRAAPSAVGQLLDAAEQLS